MTTEKEELELELEAQLYELLGAGLALGQASYGLWRLSECHGGPGLLLSLSKGEDDLEFEVVIRRTR